MLVWSIAVAAFIASVGVAAASALLLFSSQRFCSRLVPRLIIPFVLAVSAASFLYIGTANLIPTLHRDVHPSSVAQQQLVLAGVLLIGVVRSATHG